MSTHPQIGLAASPDRLDSWKEIAAYLGRSERTVRRWEDKEGLPVHRLVHEKRGTVFAYRSELDVWWESRRASIEATAIEAAAEPETQGGPLEPGRAAPSRLRRGWILWSAAVFLAAGAGLGYSLHAHSSSSYRDAGIPDWYKGNPDAYRAYLRAANWGTSFSRQRVRAVTEAYEEAIRLNPNFARAYGGLAGAQVAQTWFDDAMPARETLSRARKTAAKLHELDPQAPVYWRTESWALEYLDWNYPKAEEYRRKAMDLNPTNASTVRTYAELMIDLRRFDEALVWAKRAADLAPASPTEMQTYGSALYLAGKPEQAAAIFSEAIDAEPNAGLPRIYLARIYLDRGQFPQALEQLRKGDDLIGGVAFTRGELGRGLALAGQPAEARKILAEMSRKRGAGYYPAFGLALVNSGLGNRGETIDWLERAAEERNFGYYSPYADPAYDPIRSEPRFQQLLRKMNYIP